MRTTFITFLLCSFCLCISAQTDTTEMLIIEEPEKKIKKREFGIEGLYGYADLYRSDDNRFNPIGPNRLENWSAGVVQRSTWKYYEIRVGFSYVNKGGVELFNTPTYGLVESNVQLGYFVLKAQPIILKYTYGNFFVHAGGGFYAGYLLTSDISVGNIEYEAGTSLLSDYELDPLDYGPVLSGGIGYGPINLVVEYQAGLFNIDNNIDTTKNQFLSAGLIIWI